MFVKWPNKQSGAPGSAAGWDDLRAHNTALLFDAIWSEDGVSRADLARFSGLSRATVSDIVLEFLEAGAVSESEVAPSSGGRPPIRLRFEDGWRHLIGVEMGASHLSGVRTDLRGRVLASFKREMDVGGDPVGTLAAIDEGVRDLSRVDPGVPVLGIGVGVPSPLRAADDGRLAPHLFPRWVGVDIASHLASVHGLPVRLDNDANLGALAEHWWGAGRDVTDFAYIKVATGVGAGILIGGQIYRGATGIAGEIGHTTIDPRGPLCRCGLNGCLEAMVGSASLLGTARNRVQSMATPPVWSQEPCSIRAVIAGAQAGDAVAQDLIAGAGTALGIAIANLLNLVNPGRVILGGHLTEAGALLLDPLLAAIARRALWSSVEGSTLVVSTLGDRAVALGAATLLLESLLKDPRATLEVPAHSAPVSTAGLSATLA